MNSGWNVRTLQSAAKNVEFENTNALGSGRKYSRLKIPSGGAVFPAYDLNHSYEDTDFFISLAKLKNHATCGVTLSMKNIFGITPASIYGDDAGVDEPNGIQAQGASTRAMKASVNLRKAHSPSETLLRAANRVIVCLALWPI